MKIKSSLFYYFAICLLLFSCQTVDDKVFEEDEITIPDLVVRTSLRGVIKSEAGTLLSGTQVKIGNEIISTDENGYFAFKDITINAEGAIATISKSGYLSLQKLIIPQLADNYFQARLFPINQAGNFNNSDGGEINIPGGAIVNFSANSISDNNDNEYSGVVNVEAYYISPTNTHLGELMPGNLLGIKNNGELAVLATLGMVYVNLTSPAGSQLKIKDNASATLNFPIPEDYLASAPSFMPSWSYNEVNGYWEQELQATIDNGFYTVKVSHFSWWNADWPYDPVQLKGTLVYEDAAEARRPVENQTIRISIVDRPWISTITYSNELGKFCTEIPILNVVNLEILNDCGEVTFTKQLQQTSTDTDLGEIIINSNEVQLMSVNGTLVNCDLEPVTDGYAIVSFGEGYQFAEVNENGVFNATIPKCQSVPNILVSGYDRANLVGSEQVSFHADSFNISVGQLDVCDGGGNIFVLIVDGDIYPLNDIISSGLGVRASHNLIDESWNSEIDLILSTVVPTAPSYVFGFFGFTHYGVGVYQNVSLLPTSGFNIRGELNVIFAGNIDPLQFTELRIIESEETPNSIGAFKGEFTANWMDNLGESHDIQGYFRIK